LWRVYLCFLGIVVFSVIILIRAVYIQQIEGPFWITQAKEQQQKEVEIDPQRGTIYSEDGRMLSTSIPYFDIYVDFAADGLREKNGQRFTEHLDSLSRGLASLFKDRSYAAYKRELQSGYRKKDRYYLLKKNITFQQYKILRTLPLVRLGKDKSGFIADVKDKRLNPFGLLANRTIGLSREYLDSNKVVRSTNVGLEKTYDSLLKGESGKRVMRKIAAGVYAPIDGSEIEPENGNDIVTTIDVNIQDIAENALYKVMDENECTYGTCIVMEVATGKIKAIANLGRRPSDGSYWEDLNYAIRASEPGSTFKLATLMSLLEDNYVSLDQHVNMEGGKWLVNGRTVYDSENHGYEVTVKKAFELSSNVGMAKLAMTYYSRKPDQFIEHLKKWRFNQYSGIDLLGETPPIVKNPKSKTWSATSLPWMAFGYEVLVSPLQTLMLYNAVANEGKMMKPYLVSSVQKNGLTIKENLPAVLDESVCSATSLKLVKECLEGVCSDSGGTGYRLFKGTLYHVAGKTGTALMANGSHGYADHIYQSSFAGYFPAENPQYSCIVVIRNKPFAKKFYGADVAGPVFKEISDKLYALNADKDKSIRQFTWKKDTTGYYYAGSSADMKQVMSRLQWKYTDSAQQDEWSRVYAVNNQPVLNAKTITKNAMPDVKGMGLKDALYLLENMHVKVLAKGKGKVSMQSVEPGSPVTGNQTITIELK
jgi:cell division protein FtsI (penicillin-binding protein 3)